MRSCTNADRHPSHLIGFQGGAISEREEFAQDASGVSAVEDEVLGAVFMGKRLLEAMSGNVTDEVWKWYIENQKPNNPDDDFSVL